MAIRVLATIPELTAAPEPAVPDPTASVATAVQLHRPAPLPARRRRRASFPGISVAALALVAAAIWSLVAIRDAMQTAAPRSGTRIAVEATEGDAETTLR